MIDLFKKKKVKRLLDELEDSHNELIKERAKTKELNKRIDSLENMSSQTLLKQLECPNCSEQGYTIETGEKIL